MLESFVPVNLPSPDLQWVRAFAFQVPKSTPQSSLAPGRRMCPCAVNRDDPPHFQNEA